MTTALVRALLFAGGGAAAVAGVAYVSGALDPYMKSTPPAQIAAVQPPVAQQPASQPAGVQQPAAQQPAAEQQAAVTPTPEKPAQPAPAATGPVAPTFDVVRAEGDGSVVVAGKAAPNAKVDVVQGATVFGTTKAGPDGDFAIVLNDPLKPGNYQLQLRSTSPSNTVVPSAQTAVVAIPEKANGQVLALVEEPGKAATLLSVPKAEEKPGGEAGQQAASASAGSEAASPQATASAAQPTEPAVQSAPGAAKVAVGAVEIDGGKIFVAGTADPGRKVRAYANEILLGEAVVSEKGQFLVEATRDLPVGDYTVRVDLLDADGSKVIARAAVPFQREPGEAIAAVAPSASEAPAAPQQDTASADKAPTTVAPKLEQVDHAVIIRRGDSLWRISRRVYGHGVRYSTIYLANQQQISNPDRIWPGQVFKVPQKSKEGETADMKTLGDQATVAK